MDLINEVIKDAWQFVREPRTLLLLIVAPLLVLLVTASVFGGQSGQTNGRSVIGVCDMDASNSSSLFLDSIRNNSRVVEIVNETGCAKQLEDGVKTGKLAAGIIIQFGFEAGIKAGESQNISLFLDNSRIQVSPTIDALVTAAVEKTDEAIGTEFISTVWKRLDEADTRLGKLVGDMNDTRQRATQMRQDLNGTARSLASLDIAGVKNQITLANDTVLGASASLAEARSNLTKIETDMVGYDESLVQTESDLLAINDSLYNTTQTISNAKAAVNCSNITFSAYCASLDAFNAGIDAPRQSVEARILKVREARQSLAAANETIQQFKASIDSAQMKVGDAQTRLAKMDEFVYSLEQNRQQAISTIAAVDSSLSDTITKTYEFESIINDSRVQIREITAKKPSFVISPMLVSRKEVFGTRPYFEFMLPSLLPVILMFVALFLSSASVVREKNGGTLTRVIYSQVNLVWYAAMKVASLTIVLLPEAILLAIAASVLYGAFPLYDPGAWIVVMQSLALLLFAFVAAGVLIAVYSESESTAFLASLVVGLPLLFLSGLLFPLDFMPPLVSSVAVVSPLTQSIIGMQEAMIYDTPQEAPALALAAYGVLFTLAAGFALRKRA